MIFEATRLKGAYLVRLEKIEDSRGFFARAFCQNEMAPYSIRTDFVQCNVGFSRFKGTLRGMHYQIAPHAEAKLVRCTSGAIYDVIVDLRPDSDTYLEWFSSELTAGNHEQIYIPEGFAHGYQTLADNTELYYQVTQFYAPQFERGFRPNDPLFAIDWPESDHPVMSEKDIRWPDFVP